VTQGYAGGGVLSLVIPPSAARDGENNGRNNGDDDDFIAVLDCPVNRVLGGGGELVLLQLMSSLGAHSGSLPKDGCTASGCDYTAQREQERQNIEFIAWKRQRQSERLG